MHTQHHKPPHTHAHRHTDIVYNWRCVKIKQWSLFLWNRKEAAKGGFAFACKSRLSSDNAGSHTHTYPPMHTPTHIHTNTRTFGKGCCCCLTVAGILTYIRRKTNEDSTLLMVRGEQEGRAKGGRAEVIACYAQIEMRQSNTTNF